MLANPSHVAWYRNTSSRLRVAHCVNMCCSVFKLYLQSRATWTYSELFHRLSTVPLVYSWLYLLRDPVQCSRSNRDVCLADRLSTQRKVVCIIYPVKYLAREFWDALNAKVQDKLCMCHSFVTILFHIIVTKHFFNRRWHKGREQKLNKTLLRSFKYRINALPMYQIRKANLIGWKSVAKNVKRLDLQ